MFQEQPRPFHAEIPDEIRDRAAAPAEDIDVPAQARARLRELGMLAAGAGLVIGAAVLGAIAGVLIAGVVLVILARSAGSDVA